MLLESGTSQQKDSYFLKLINGQYIGAMAITEPDVGSSFEKMSTILDENDENFTLNGTKSLINDAAEADVLGVMAKSRQGFTMVLLEKGTPGFRITKTHSRRGEASD